MTLKTEPPASCAAMDAVRIGLAGSPPAGERGALYYLTLGQFVAAFTAGRLPIPPIPRAGQELRCPRYEAGELRRLIGSELPRGRLSRMLKEEFRVYPHAGLGYDLLELYEAMESAYRRWQSRADCGADGDGPGLDRQAEPAA